MFLNRLSWKTKHKKRAELRPLSCLVPSTLWFKNLSNIKYRTLTRKRLPRLKVSTSSTEWRKSLRSFFFPCRQVPRWRKLVVQLIRIFFQSIIQSRNKYQSLSLSQGNSYWWRRRAAVFWLLIDGVWTWALDDILRCSWSTHITFQTLTLPFPPPPPHEYE